MIFDTAAAYLRLNEQERAHFSIRWEASEAAFQEHPDILDPGCIRAAFAEVSYKEDLADRLTAAAEKISAVPELKHFLWHIYHRTLLDPQGGQWMPNYLIPEDLIGREEAGLFNLLAALGSVPLIDAIYADMDLPREMALRHHGWLRGTIDIFRAAHSFPGHSLNQTAWSRLAIDRRLFRIGRFEYVLESAYPAFAPIVYIHKTTGKIAVLARPDWTFDAQWRRCRAEHAVHKGFFEDAGGIIRGIRLCYDGTVDREPCELNAAEWRPLPDSPWSAVLTMHIPGGERMPPDAAKESLSQAADFFAKHLHREIKLILCSSWILNPEWQVRMPDSNLAVFQRSVFLVQQEEPQKNTAGLFFVFGREDVDPATTVPANTMQKVMLDVLKEGGKLRGGIMVMPVQCIGDFGHPERF